MRMPTNQYGISTTLADYAGHHVLVLWADGFPAPSDSEVWTWLGEDYTEFTARNTKIITVTRQNVDANRQFTDRFELIFDVLSDPDAQLIAELKSKLVGTGKPEFCLINPAGKVVKSSLGRLLKTELEDLLSYLDSRRLIGDQVPDANVFELVEQAPKLVHSETLFSNQRVVLFGVPGAYTPACSAEHLPGFLDHYDDLRSRGADSVICIAVNDPFVMDAWGRAQEVKGRIRMVADGDGSFTRAMGLTLDLGVFGLGKRSKRYAMIVDDGVIRHFNVEAGPLVGSSSAADMLALL
jgi:peroxiredoxin